MVIFSLIKSKMTQLLESKFGELKILLDTKGKIEMKTDCCGKNPCKEVNLQEWEECKFPTPEQERARIIEEMAYYKWQNAGCPIGQCMEFWLEAEQEYEKRE